MIWPLRYLVWCAGEQVLSFGFQHHHARRLTQDVWLASIALAKGYASLPSFFDCVNGVSDRAPDSEGRHGW